MFVTGTSTVCDAPLGILIVVPSGPVALFGFKDFFTSSLFLHFFQVVIMIE